MCNPKHKSLNVYTCCIILFALFIISGCSNSDTTNKDLSIANVPNDPLISAPIDEGNAIITTKTNLLAKKTLHIGLVKTTSSPVQFLDGDSTVFVYSYYMDWGGEGGGFVTCFTMPSNFDSLNYSHTTNKKLIFKFATGFLPEHLDTLKSYNLKIVKNGESIKIDGNIDSLKIYQEFIPLNFMPKY